MGQAALWYPKDLNPMEDCFLWMNSPEWCSGQRSGSPPWGHLSTRAPFISWHHHPLGPCHQLAAGRRKQAGKNRCESLTVPGLEAACITTTHIMLARTLSHGLAFLQGTPRTELTYLHKEGKGRLGVQSSQYFQLCRLMTMKGDTR